jgi:hypothetical protein
MDMLSSKSALDAHGPLAHMPLGTVQLGQPLD